jgi:hypothetical protein
MEGNMKTVRRYPICLKNDQIIPLPKSAKVLSVTGGLSAFAGVALHVLVEASESDIENWRIKTCRDSDKRNDLISSSFIGTVVLLNDNLAYHVFANKE